jgi:hypothetical protein
LSKDKPSERFFEFASFLASAARGSVEEGGLGASLRFLDAMSRLPTLTAKPNEDKFLGEMSDLIKKRMNADFLASREKYIELLDEILVRFAKEIRMRNGLDSR